MTLMMKRVQFLKLSISGMKKAIVEGLRKVWMNVFLSLIGQLKSIESAPKFMVDQVGWPLYFQKYIFYYVLITLHWKCSACVTY